MLAEGSLIAWPSSNLAGKIENLRPEYDASVGDFPHPVWRSGLAVAVGLKDHQEGR